MEVRLLGPAEVRVSGAPVTKWRAGKARTLLQHLAVRWGTVVPRSELIDVLWPYSEQGVGNASLKVAIHALRKALRDCSAGLGRPVAEVRFVDFGYELVADDLWVDSNEFAAAAHEGSALEGAGDIDGACSAYERALETYRGPFLPEDDSEWAREERMWAESRYLKVLCRLGAIAAEKGQDLVVIDYCKRVIDLDPYNEQAYRTMMEMHGRNRELGMALRWYSKCEERMKGLGVLPSASTRQSLTQVLALCDIAVGDGREGDFPVPRQGAGGRQSQLIMPTSCSARRGSRP
jgi:DNA-binding SARP family transcriptional activator